MAKRSADYSSELSSGQDSMGNKNSRSRLTRSFEQFDPVAPSSSFIPVVVDSNDSSRENIETQEPIRRSSKLLNKVAPSPEQTSDTKNNDEQQSIQEPSPDVLPFDFNMTEGQTRRTLMAECEFECSQITSNLFVGGAEVAKSWETLQQQGITQVINCSASVVDTHFIHKKNMSYLALSMVDGRQDDIAWFFCEVVQCIRQALRDDANVLLHCEKGISRSCSYAIAYYMFSEGVPWKDAFDHVKTRRIVCNPNTAFTCNIMEISELTHGKARQVDILLRLASHLPHDPDTLVLKPCRDASSRRLLLPSTRLMHCNGVFVLRPRYVKPSNDADAGVSHVSGISSSRGSEHREDDAQWCADSHIYVWHGAGVPAASITAGVNLARHMVGIFAPDDAVVVVVAAGMEPESFWKCCAREGSPEIELCWDDLVLEGQIAANVNINATSSAASSSASETDLLEKPPRVKGISLRGIDAGAGAGGGGTKSNDEIRSSSATATMFLEESPCSLSPPSTPPRALSGESVGGGMGTMLALGCAGSRGSGENLLLNNRSNGKLSKNNSGVSTGSPSGLFAYTSTPSTSSLPFHLSPNTSTASMDCPGFARRTSSADKYPREPGLIREPTPVEDLIVLQRKMSPIGTDLPSSNDTTQVLTPRTAARAGAQFAAITKPHLYQAVTVTDGDADCAITVYGWQSLGVYDDDDLVEGDVLLLSMPAGRGPHFLWVGHDFDVHRIIDVVEGELEEFDEDNTALRQWSCQVIKGDLHCALRAEDVSIEVSGQESEAFWTAFSEGF